MKLFEYLRFDEKGLIPAIIQDETTQMVLTLCYMNREALKKTFEEGRIYLFRRSKGRLMMKGETSGHIQIVKKVFIDCEGNSLLFIVNQNIAACHAGYFSCYFRNINKDGIVEIVERKIFEPKDVSSK